MQLKTKVKVGNITNLSDARYCAGMGVGLLGFPISNPDGSLLSPEKFADITGWVSGPEFVIEVPGSELSTSYKIIENYSAHYIQLDAAHCELFDPAYIEQLIIALDIHEWEKWKKKIEAIKSKASYLLIRNSQESNPVDFLKVLAEMSQHVPLLLNFGIEKAKLPEILQLPIAGIALNGSEEEKPGMKDYDQLADILEALETE